MIKSLLNLFGKDVSWLIWEYKTELEDSTSTDVTVTVRRADGEVMFFESGCGSFHLWEASQYMLKDLCFKDNSLFSKSEREYYGMELYSVDIVFDWLTNDYRVDLPLDDPLVEIKYFLNNVWKIRLMCYGSLRFIIRQLLFAYSFQVDVFDYDGFEHNALLREVQSERYKEYKQDNIGRKIALRIKRFRYVSSQYTVAFDICLARYRRVIQAATGKRFFCRCTRCKSRWFKQTSILTYFK